MIKSFSNPYILYFKSYYWEIFLIFVKLGMSYPFDVEVT